MTDQKNPEVIPDDELRDVAGGAVDMGAPGFNDSEVQSVMKEIQRQLAHHDDNFVEETLGLSVKDDSMVSSGFGSVELEVEMATLKLR